jgi:hypothetical protein
MREMNRCAIANGLPEDDDHKVIDDREAAVARIKTLAAATPVGCQPTVWSIVQGQMTGSHYESFVNTTIQQR